MAPGGTWNAELADVLTSVQTSPSASILLVECNGTFGFDTIQGAINEARDGDVVVVLPRNAFGVRCEADSYVENINFAGKAITVRSVDPLNPDCVEATIIDGSSALDDDIEGSVVTFNSGEGADSVLEGFTLSGGIGYMWRDARYRRGGGVLCNGSSPTIAHCRIIRNSATTSGGGIKCGNSAAPMIRNCLVSENTAESGGGISCFQSSLTLQHCVVAGNTATDFGGGIEAAIGTITSPHLFMISNSLVVGNTAWGGGGIFRDRLDTSIQNCVIVGNVARIGGGVHCVSGNRFEIINCTVATNYAHASGGGLAVARAAPLIGNSIIWGNRAAKTGAEIRISGRTSDLTITHCAIREPDNSIFVVLDAPPLLLAPSNSDAEPLFQDVHGEDGILGTVDDDLRLSRCSAAINTGDNALVQVGTDIDGNLRIAESVVDLGAFEYTGKTGADSDGDGVEDSCDNCPDTSNPTQENVDGDELGDACDDDIDADGIPNEADNCSTVPNATQQDTDNDTVGDACDACPGFNDAEDLDGDGVPDACDNCPETPNSAQEDLDFDNHGDTCDPDDDGDGWPDDGDNCPTVPNPAQEDDDRDGWGHCCAPEMHDLWLDTDWDAVRDTCDNCPYVPNTNQADRDRNGIGDVCEYDLTHLALFVACFGIGDQFSERIPSTSMIECLGMFDFDVDGDVGLPDYGILLDTMMGPARHPARSR